MFFSYPRKRGSFIHSEKRCSFMLRSELPLHTRKRGVRLYSGVSFLVLGKEPLIYPPREQQFRLLSVNSRVETGTFGP